MTKNMALLWVGILAIPAGCALTPKYDRPDAPVPAEWPSHATGPDIESVTNAPIASSLSWREFFADPELQQVMETALKNNRDLRLAALNVERAKAFYGIQRSELLPTVNALGSGSKQRTPADLSSSGDAQTSERYDVNLGIASWEIDFFGRLRSLKDRALKEYLATEQAHRSAQVLLIAGVAQAYLSLAADRDQLTLTETTLDTQQKVYDLIRRNYQLGLADESDLYRAQTQVDAARGDQVRYTQVVAQDKNALNLLVGAPVDELLIPSTLADISQPKDVVPGLSSKVLLQRPDVLQAENLLKAANADIGAARAMLFPRLALTTAIGTASRELSGLFESGSDAWSFAPRVSMPIFDSRTWSALKASKVQRTIILTQYEKTIQTAFREVADALAVRGSMDQQVAFQESLVHAVSETHRLSGIRYERGLDSYLAVLDAQRSLYAAQQRLVTLRLARLTSLVRLYAALGGGADR